MFRTRSTVVAAAMLALSAAYPCLASATGPAVATPNTRRALPELPVTWDYVPYERMKQKYPKIAKQRNQPGSVLISCDWDDKGRVTECELIRENPEGFGFGAATLEIMKDGTVKSRIADQPLTAGKGLKLFVNWRQ